MLVMIKSTGSLIEVSHPEGLWDPFEKSVRGQRLAGEEMQDMEDFSKSQLAFLSGEKLPLCWLDTHYRDSDWQQYRYESVAAVTHTGPINYYGA
jgi:hypothetical protein